MLRAGELPPLFGEVSFDITCYLLYKILRRFQNKTIITFQISKYSNEEEKVDVLQVMTRQQQ